MVKEGEYYFGRHRSSWGVWKKGREENGVSMDDFITDFSTRIQASMFCTKMNNNNNNYGTEQ